MILTALILTLTGVFNPVDIDVFEGGLLWAAQLEGKIMRSDKFGEDEIKTIQTGLHMPRAVSVYHIYRYDISSELNFLVLNLCPPPASLLPPTCCTTFLGREVAHLVECQVRQLLMGTDLGWGGGSLTWWSVRSGNCWWGQIWGGVGGRSLGGVSGPATADGDRFGVGWGVAHLVECQVRQLLVGTDLGWGGGSLSWWSVRSGTTNLSPWCCSEFFSQSQLSVQTPLVLQCLYSPCAQSHMSVHVKNLKC